MLVLLKKKPSLAAVLAIVSFTLILGGMCVAKSPAVTATPMGTLIDATRHVRDSTDEVPMVFYWAGVIVAAVFVLGYVFTMGVRDPYAKKRHKPD